MFEPVYLPSPVGSNTAESNHGGRPPVTAVVHFLRTGVAKAWAFCAILAAGVCPHALADDVFIYSAQSQIRGINLDLGTENLLTTSPFSTAVNALAANSDDGVVYYGDGTQIYVWDPALGNGAAAHSSMNDFATGPVTAPITNLDSGSGSYLDGIYYVGSEEDVTGDANELYAITLSADGRSIVSAQALGLLTACACTGDEIGGFGDIAAVQEGGSTVLYGVSTGGSDATKTGRWRLDLGTDTFTHLANGANGQLSNSLAGQLYTNVGNAIRTQSKTTGAVGTTDLFVLSGQIFDFTSGFSLDFGDAPASYGSAMHRVPAQVAATTFVGVNPPDNEAGTLDLAAGGADGLGDDQAGLDDEDAISALSPMPSDATAYAFPVTCTAGASISAWIDFDRNGSFDNDERNNNAPQVCTGASMTLSWTALPTSTAGSSYVRIRVADSAAEVAGPTGLANSGEIEDHPLTIVDSTGSGACPAGQSSLVFPATDVPQTIPVTGGGTAATSSTLTITDTSTILDINVIDVVGTHSWLDDIVMSLNHNGTNVSLFARECGNNDNFDFGFDDESTTALVCPPVNGEILAPETALSVFDNTSIAGDWTLDIQDVFPTEDGGILQSWGLQICTSALPAEAPELRLGKVASVADTGVTLTFRVLNTGNTDLSSISLTDDLDEAFGSGNYTIVQAPQIITAPSGFTINAAYTGNGLQTNLLGTTGTLASGEEIRVRLSVRIDNLPAGVSTAAYTNEAYASGISPGNGFAEDLSAPSLDLSIDIDQPTSISVQNDLRLSGRVFLDASTDSNTSHDGVVQSGEPGVSDRLVSIFNVGTGELIDRVLTNGNGDWAVALDGSLAGTSLRIAVQAATRQPFVSEASAHASGSVTDGEVLLTPVAGVDVSGIDIGVVERPTLLQDQTQTAQPNARVLHTHRYQVPSPGQLSVGLAVQTDPSGSDWPTRLLRDQNCDGAVDAADQIVSAPISVVKDELVCLLVDVFVPADLPLGATQTATLSADLVLADVAGTGHGLQFALQNTDVIRVVSPSDGRLLLTKTVRNLSDGGAAVTSNTALPGHTLEYTIHYRNQGGGSISELVINDSAPAYTQVLGGSVVCVSTPAPLNCTPGVASSDVQWDFVGNLAAGAQGSVRYQVTVD